LDPDVLCILAAGSYVDIDVLVDEIGRTGLSPDRLVVDPNAMVVTHEDRAAEAESGLRERIGSTLSGTGSAVVRRIKRRSVKDLAGAQPELAPYLRPTRALLRDLLAAEERVVVEGTQGFGLSVLHTPHFPKATARDTTAAGALSETGLSPFDVDEVVLVLRAFPIRVAGDSGPFGSEEIDWSVVTREGGHPEPLVEYSSVTRQVRRVARFDPLIVREAIAANSPSLVVLNHVDYCDADAEGHLTPRRQRFLDDVEAGIGRRVDLVGLGPDVLLPRDHCCDRSVFVSVSAGRT
jgi:adenylosuccinate synthase